MGLPKVSLLRLMTLQCRTLLKGLWLQSHFCLWANCITFTWNCHLLPPVFPLPSIPPRLLLWLRIFSLKQHFFFCHRKLCEERTFHQSQMNRIGIMLMRLPLRFFFYFWPLARRSGPRNSFVIKTFRVPFAQI